MLFGQTYSVGVALRNRAAGVFMLILVQSTFLAAADPYRIQIIDAENGWPVPMVELASTHHVRWISDNAGVIAMDAPELMNRLTWFSVRGHGYQVSTDGFGYRGVRLTPKPGETGVVKVDRQLPAKRLGRITGAGLFAESKKFWEQDPTAESKSALTSSPPESSASGVFGCDSVQNVRYAGKLFWLWGDTTLGSYPLGRFHTTGAWSDEDPIGKPEPPIDLRFNYFRGEDSLPRNIAEMPGDGPTWLDGLTTVSDDEGNQRLVARYTKIRPPLAAYQIGLCIWNSESLRFEHHRTLWNASDEQPNAPEPSRSPSPHGHAARWTDSAGTSWLLFGDPFPTMRCRASMESWSDPTSWEQLSPQASVPVKTVGTNDSAAREVKPHRGSIAWNDYRNKWVTVFTQLGGQTSYLGELWYAEADQPTGPWRDAVHIVTHDRYTFYNPKIEMELTEPGSPILLFEATYTHTFSATTNPTPRYDYNQILYRLDLDQ